MVYPIVLSFLSFTDGRSHSKFDFSRIDVFAFAISWLHEISVDVLSDKNDAKEEFSLKYLLLLS